MRPTRMGFTIDIIPRPRWLVRNRIRQFVLSARHFRAILRMQVISGQEWRVYRDETLKKRRAGLVPAISGRSNMSRSIGITFAAAACALMAICTGVAARSNPIDLKGRDLAPGQGKARPAKTVYVCPECGQECDNRTFDAPGNCPTCG